MVALIKGVGVPVDRDLVRHEVHVDVIAAEFFRELLQAVVLLIVPVDRARRTQKDELRADGVAVILDHLGVHDVDLRDVFLFVGRDDVVLVCARIAFYRVFIAFVIVPPGAFCGEREIVSGHFFPSVMVAKDREKFTDLM